MKYTSPIIMITTPKNSKKYHRLEFFPVDHEVLVEMKLDITLLGNGKLLMVDYG